MRNIAEYLVIVVVWFLTQKMIAAASLSHSWMMLFVLSLAWIKSLFFGGENLRQLWKASRENMPYHRFMLLMLVNMSQIILSFGLDYHCLHVLRPDSFSSIDPAYEYGELVFEFCYYSVLNFTFFGYGDVTPHTIPAKLLTMTEVLLAFVTVIFLLSDFISLKESIASPKADSDAVRPSAPTAERIAEATPIVDK